MSSEAKDRSAGPVSRSPETTSTWTGVSKPYQSSTGLLISLGFTAVIFGLTWLYRPELWNQAFFVYASAAYLAVNLARHPLLHWLGTPGHPDRLLTAGWYASFAVDALYCTFIVFVTGGDHSPFLLFAALLMLHFASQRPSVSEALRTGGVATLVLVTFVFALHGVSADVARRLVVTAVLLWLVFLGAVIAMRTLVAQRRALERANQESRELNERLAALAFTDSLTGLCNHRQFHAHLADELEKAASAQVSLALILADIDSFKHYNDLWGHTAGDTVLKQAAEIFLKTVPTTGVVARYGGQQFAVILPGADTRKAMAMAEQLRRAVEAFPFEHRELQPNGKITISVGVVVFPDNGATKNELLRKADEALYQAKERHRNTVQLYFSVLDDLNEDLGRKDAQAIGIVQTLIALINARDGYTYGHSERVAEYAGIIASELGLGEPLVKLIRYAGILHDVGKIEVAREILTKPGDLTTAQREAIERHPVFGAKIIEPVRGLKDVVPIVRHHHERYDGTGYPDKLRGRDIPLPARILAVADSFDAMRTDRPYRRGLPLEKAVAELERNAGTQFDPEIVAVFVRALERQLESKLA